jgi:hypothetical protein
MFRFNAEFLSNYSKAKTWGRFSRTSPLFICCFEKQCLIFAKRNEMITKLLEATAIINNKTINIINTQMDIYVDWDIEIIKKESSAIIKCIFKEVKGHFEYVSKNEAYKKIVSIEFKSDSNTKISHIPSLAENLEPVSAVINLDLKTIQIKF